MKSSEIKSFFNFLMSHDTPRISISERFAVWLKDSFDISELEALDIIDLNIKKAKLLITKDIDFHASKYTYPKYKFAAYDNDILIATQFDSVEEKESVYSKINWWENLNKLIKLLDWRDFELLAKQILAENGLNNIEITKAQNDQGIDFYGFFQFDTSKLSYRLYNDIRFRIVGQVKHSTGNHGVDHQKVASFGTEIKKLRSHNNSSYFVNLDDTFLSSPYPTLGIFITNSYYPNKAIDFANEYGIIYWDGIQISQDLATPDFISKIKDDTNTLSINKLKEIIQGFA